MSWRRFNVLVKGLPPDSALAHALQDQIQQAGFPQKQKLPEFEEDEKAVEFLAKNLGLDPNKVKGDME